jgi:site-specific DNA recombinase
MHVLGYTRVSTQEQADEGVSLAAQAQKIAAYCTVKDWTLTEIIEDAGHSAKSLVRPGLQRLLGLVDAEAIQVVVIYKLDRLTRSVSDVDRLITRFDKKGVALVSLQESLDATTATGRLMINLLASVSQWEREVIGERTSDALQHLKAHGAVYCRPVCTDAALIAWMRQQREAGCSYRAIAAQLDADEIPTLRGGRWAPMTVRNILRRQPRQTVPHVA